MPVKWLLYWQPNQGSTPSLQILTDACACVESMGGAQRGGKWRTSLTFYRPAARDGGGAVAVAAMMPEPPRDFLGLQLHEQPGKYYFILRPHHIVLEADSSIQLVMERLQSYKARILLSFEGSQYQLGDFQVRVGKCVHSMSETNRGIMMEVEYLPISSLEKSRQILEEFVEVWQETISKKLLPGHFLHVECNFADYGLQDCYTPQHTVLQYATCMQQLIIIAGKN